MRSDVFNIVKAAIEELNEELEYESLDEVNEQTPIFGGESGIDSLSLVSLVSNVESGIYEKFEKSVSLADEKAMSMRNSPYRDVASLVDFAVSRLGD